MADDNVVEEPKGENALDALMKQFDENKSASENKEILQRLSSLEAENKELREKTDAALDQGQQASYREDIRPVIQTLKGDLAIEDRVVEDWINSEANRNKELKDGWDSRRENPAAFEEMVGGLAPKFQDYIKGQARAALGIKEDDPEPEEDDKPKGGDTVDDAAKSAARAARISRNANTPSAGDDDYDKVDWPGLSGHEFALQQQKVFNDMKTGKLKPEAKNS